ncbi:MAG: cytochrome c-type biogenesis protein CcmH, partial [Egibacteraceae bacterium]
AVGLARAAAPPAPATHAERGDAVAETLRCPTCQGLSVADSPSTVAASMRDIIGEQLAAGRSPDEVRAWFVARYGEWILLSPTAAGLGRLVWLAPAVLVVAGAGIALTVARRRRDRPAGDLDQAAMEEPVAAYADGRLSVPDTSAGERLASALALLEAVRSDREAGWSSSDAEQAALAGVAEALQELAHEPDEPPGRPAPGDAAPRWGRLPRSLRWAGLASAFLAVAVALLAANVSPRSRGDLPTGNLPEPSAGTTQETEIAGLHEAVSRDPSDTRSRLLLAASLLRAGRIADAEVQADRLLELDPDNLDALVLTGIAKLQQDDPAGRRALRRFLDAAPADHPGRPAAEGLLNPDDAP